MFLVLELMFSEAVWVAHLRFDLCDVDIPLLHHLIELCLPLPHGAKHAITALLHVPEARSKWVQISPSKRQGIPQNVVWYMGVSKTQLK